LISSRLQGLAKNPVVSGQYLDLSAESWLVCAPFQLNDRCEWLFGTLSFK
jgi:hypothetical protein